MGSFKIHIILYTGRHWQEKTLANSDYLEEETFVNSLFQINTEIKASVKLREKTLAIGHQFTKFANVFSCQRFLLYGSLRYV